MPADRADAGRRAVRMGSCQLGDDRPRFRCDRYERFAALASAVIARRQSGPIRRPAAASAKSERIPAQHPDMGCDASPVDHKAVLMDGRDVAETDDRVADLAAPVGDRAADCSSRSFRFPSPAPPRPPLASAPRARWPPIRQAKISVSEVPPTTASPRCQTFPATSSRRIAGSTGKAATNRSTIARGRISKVPRSRGSISTRPATGQKWK